LNIQRTNCLFYNLRVLNQLSIDISKINTAREFIQVLKQVADETDQEAVFPLPLKSPWTALQLWETIFQSVNGLRLYDETINKGRSVKNNQAI
jgi:glucose/mannose transport system substrate-binding protein